MTGQKTPASSERRSLPRHAAILFGLAAGIIAFPLGMLFWPAYAFALGANAMFGVYLGLTLYEAPCLSPAFLRRRAADTDPPVGIIFTTVVLAGRKAAETATAASSRPPGSLRRCRRCTRH